MENLFYLFATGAVISAAMCILRRNPISAVMWLVATMFSVAGIYLLLEAPFIAAIQVLVYAGAVMVLFLFVIMLLDLREEERRKLNKVALGAGALAVAVIAGILIRAALSAVPAATTALEGTTKPLGRLLFTEYLLPFEILSLLLLVAMVGVILLSKKELK